MKAYDCLQYAEHQTHHPPYRADLIFDVVLGLGYVGGAGRATAGSTQKKAGLFLILLVNLRNNA